jgi:hypothetical protein
MERSRIPAVLVLPPKVIAKWPWLISTCVGAALGALALLLILLFLSGGKLSLDRTETLWIFAILNSTVSFVVYAALLRRHHASN